MPAIRVALVGGLNLVRHGLRFVLSKENDMAVVGEVADTSEASRLITDTPTDVLMLDAPMPGQTGLLTARQLLQQDGSLNILCMSALLSEDAIAEGLSMGVLGFISYTQPATDFLAAIRSVAARRLYLSPTVSRIIVDEYRRRPRKISVAASPLETLSGREREVLQLLLQGLSNIGIAARLNISRRTVETHRAHVMKKLHLRSIRDLFRYGAEHGLLNDEPFATLSRQASLQPTVQDDVEQELPATPSALAASSENASSS